MNNMSKLQNYSYRLRTVSKLVLSPRVHQGFYMDAGDFEERDVQLGVGNGQESGELQRVNIIYPFYQYGDYPRYSPGKSEYYIPGSSIKGAVSAGGMNRSASDPSTLMIDDIPVSRGDISLSLLHKLQYTAADAGAVALMPFFPNIAVEMLAAGCEYEGELYSNVNIQQLLNIAQKETNRKFEQWKDKLLAIRSIKDDSKTDKQIDVFLECLDAARRKLSGNNGYVLVLGGYKGLALSGVFSNKEILRETNSAVYIDETTFLPHGIVELHLM